MRIVVLLIFFTLSLFAQDQAPLINLSVAQVEEPEQFVKTINIAILLALFVLAPTLLLMATSFTRLIIVFSLLRQALGLQQSPPNQVIVSMALIMTFFIMQPYGQKAWDEGIQPYMDKKIGIISIKLT
jgi:flagellar biosynthetic protein FliP